MKTLSIITILYALYSAQTAIAQVALEASSQAVTITFTGKEQVPGYSVKDPETNEISNTTEFTSTKSNAAGDPTQEVVGYKMSSKSFKYGNKELLQEVLGDGVSISGWSIVYQDGALFASKKNEESIPIESVTLPNIGEKVFTESSTTTTNTSYNKDGEPTGTTQTYSASGTYEGTAEVLYQGATMVGYLAGAFKAATWYEAYTDENDKIVLDKSSVQSVLIPGAVKITGLSGSLSSDEEGSKIFTGSINLAAASALKVSTL